MVSSSGSPDHDALPSAKKFLYKIRDSGQWQFWFLTEKIFSLKLKDAFMPRALIYGYINSNPEIASGPIQSHFLNSLSSFQISQHRLH
jgi:hypothetical protein